MKGKIKLVSLLAIFLAFSFFFYLSIAQESVNSSQNLATDENSSEQLVPTNLSSEYSDLQENVEEDTTTTTTALNIFENETTTTTTNKEDKESELPQTEAEQETQYNESTTIETIYKPKISLKLKIDKNRITRGESFLLKVLAINEGGNARNVKISVDLPEGFSTESSEKICDIVETNSSCETEFLVKSSLDTHLGKNEIKVRVSYE